MKPLVFLQLSNLENNIHSYSDRVPNNISPTLYKTLQKPSLKQSLTARSSELKLSIKNKSLLQQRRAIRSILENNSPQNSPKSNNFEVKGSQRIYLKSSVSPDVIKPRKHLLSPIPKSKTSQIKVEGGSLRTIIRSETLNSNRRLVPLGDFILEKSETESYEDSLRIESKYYHN